MSSQIGSIHLSTWNVNGLGNPIKKKKVMTMLRSKKYDVVFLQETHLSIEESEKLRRGWVGHVFYSIGSSKSKGVIILISKHLQFKCLKQIKDDSGRMIIVLAEIQSQKLILANIYAPNVDDQDFFFDLERKLQAAGDQAVVLGGDFNLLMDPALDQSGAVLRRVPKSSMILKNICKSLGLIDIWRIINPSGRDYTYFSPVHKTYSRIDFFLISKALTSSTVGCEIGNILISDHAWVGLDLLPQSERRKSYRWRLNSSLLQDPVKVEWLRTELKDYFGNPYHPLARHGRP